VTDPFVKEIIEKAKGNPGRLKFLQQYYELHGEAPKMNTKNIDMQLVTNTLFSMRYMFMFLQQWQLYSLFSMIAYTAMSIRRMMRKRY